MKVLLTHGYFLKEDEKEQEIMRPYPPLGMLYVSAYLKNKNQNVSLVDSTFISKTEWKQKIKDESPDIIAFYANLVTKLNVLELLHFIHKEYPSIITCVGGPDVTYNIENYINAGFHYAISGEGEQTLHELTEQLSLKQPINSIQGIAYKENDEIVQNEARTKIKELNTLPFPDRDSIPIEKYLSTWKEYHGKRTLNISTQRGCPYTCKWCSTAVYGQSYRRNPPIRVVEEILHLQKEFGAEALWFVDDVFTVSHKWITELHLEFKKNNLVIPFEIITRAERLNDRILTQLKEMGCFRIWIGAESGSQKIIDKMDRRVSLEVVQEMIQKTRAFGIEAGTFIMVGYPEEKHEDILATMDHIKKCCPDYLTITKAYPIKGTGLYNEVEKDFIGNLDWNESTDRDITFELPYSDTYYDNAIRYLVNGWKAKRFGSIKDAVKSKLALSLMKLNK